MKIFPLSSFFYFKCVELIYFGVALANDLMGTNEVILKNRPLIRKAKDYIFSSFAFPLSFFVSVMFWGIYFFDRDSIAPKEYEPFFPVWLNHFIHTDIVIFVLIELFILHRTYPKITASLIGLFTFVLSYVLWIHIVYWETEVWVYPILDKMNTAEKIGFWIFNAIFPCFFYFVGRFLNNFVWNQKRVTEIVTSKRTEAYN
jgi:hypothetical protein